MSVIDIHANRKNIRKKLRAAGVIVSKFDPEQKTKAKKSPPYIQTPKHNEPPPTPSFSVIGEAIRVLEDRVLRRKDVWFLDGKVATIPDILKAANRLRQERGETMLGKNPERWV